VRAGQGFLAVLLVGVAMVAASATASAGQPPGPLALSMQCSGTGPNGSALPGQTDNCGVYLSGGTLNAGSSVHVTFTSPSFSSLTCQAGVRNSNACNFTLQTSQVGHGVIGGASLVFNAEGTVMASAAVNGGPVSMPVTGPGATVTFGIRPRFFPTPPYAYDVCVGPNADGTASETQVDTCSVYLSGGGGQFIAGDHLEIDLNTAAPIATVASCAGSTVTSATVLSTSNGCDFVFTGTAGGAGTRVGTVHYYIPSTTEPSTPIGQVAFYCSAFQQGQPRDCTDMPVTIQVQGPGATVIDEIPPTFTFVPAGITVDATGPIDTVVTYASPTATDNAPGPVTIACSPASGAMFAVGTTVVTCTATDASGNVATATFNVTAQNTPDSLCRVTQLEVTKLGVAHSLCVKLQHGAFDAFINEVEAQSGKALTDQQAQDLEGLAGLLIV
jgi:hypothetical protein